MSGNPDIPIFGNQKSVEDVIPQVFSRATTQSMANKVITKSVRCEIGETLSHRVYSVMEYPTSSEYTAICVALITKYPVLADTYGNGYVSHVNWSNYTLLLRCHKIFSLGIMETNTAAKNEEFSKTCKATTER